MAPALAALVLLAQLWLGAGIAGASIPAAAGTAIRATATRTAIRSSSAPPALQATEGQQFSGQVATVAIDCAAGSASGSGTIMWGDGQNSPAQLRQAGTSELEVSGSHTYAEEGSYPGSVSGTWYCGSTPHSFSATFTAQVADAPLSAAAQPVGATAGQAFSGTVATFSDSDPAGGVSDYTASIDWGDGGTSAGTLAASGSGFAVDGSHTYQSAGSYLITVTIDDRGGAQTVAHATATVAAAGARATFMLPPGPLHTGRQLIFDASASRQGAAGITGFRWTLDGHPAASCAGSTSELQTRFLAPGAHTLALTITTTTGATSTEQQTLTLSGPGLLAGSARAGRALRILRTQQVFACLRGPSDPIARIVPPTSLPTPGTGCQTEVQAAIFDAVGCLTEHQDQITLGVRSATSPNSGLTYTAVTAPLQLLPGVPSAEAGTLISAVNEYLASAGCSQFTGQQLDNCVLALDCQGAQRGQGCPQAQGATSYYANTPPPIMHAGPFEPARAATASAPRSAPRARAASLAPVGHPAPVFLQSPCSLSPPPAGQTQASACLDLWVSAGPVRINGIDYVPEPGAVVAIAPQLNLVVSSDARVDIADLEAKPPGEVFYQLPDTGQPPGQDFPAFDVSDLPGLLKNQPQAKTEFGSVGGFQTDPDSSLGVDFAPDLSAHIHFQVDLPAPFTTDDGQPAVATVDATISDTQGLQINYADLGGVNGGGLDVNMGGVALSDFGACFRHQASSDPSLDPCPGVTGIDDTGFGNDFWDASGTLTLGGQQSSVKIVFRGSPPSDCTAVGRLGIGFSGTSLAFAGAGLQTPGVPIAPGVNFDSLYASFDTTNPGYDLLSGCAKFGAGGSPGDELVQLTGQFLAAFTKNGGTYTFRGCDQSSPPCLPYLQPPDPYTKDFGIGIGAGVSLNLPVLGVVQLAGGYLVYVDDPEAVFFGAGADFSIPFGNTYEQPPDTGIALKASINGAIGLSHGFPPPFFLQGSLGVIAQAPLGNRLQGSVQGIFSDDPSTGTGGIAFCGQASAELFEVDLGSVSGGIGYHWGDSFNPTDTDSFWSNDIHFGGGCDWISGFQVNVQGASAAQAGRIIRVPRGAKAVDLWVAGRGGAPDVTVRGPGGIRVSTAGIPLTHATRLKRLMLARMPAGALTLIAIEHPRPGSYEVAPNPGSPAIRSLREDVSFTPRVSARVSGRGIHRRLRYRIAPQPGETVTFIERSRQAERILGVARGARGTIAFLAAAGHGRRQILAEVSDRGEAAPPFVVASYLAPPLQRLRRVRHLRVRRSRNDATVTFSRVPGAHFYAIEVILSDGSRRLYRTTGHRLTVGGIYLEVGGRVIVRAAGDGVYSASGAPALARIPAALKPRRLLRRRHRR